MNDRTDGSAAHPHKNENPEKISCIFMLTLHGVCVSFAWDKWDGMIARI
jgi:hypothetical protein